MKGVKIMEMVHKRWKAGDKKCEILVLVAFVSKDAHMLIVKDFHW